MKFFLTIALFLLSATTVFGQVSFEPVDAGITPQLEAWAAQIPTNRWFWGATAIDYDGDGDSDIILTSHNNTPTGVHNSKFFRNNFVPDGIVSFTEVTDVVFPGGIDFHENKPHVWDVDNDGDWDLVCGTRGKTYINQGDGTFLSNGQNITTTERTQLFPLKDLNGDGLLDLERLGASYSVTTVVRSIAGPNGIFTTTSGQLQIPEDLPQSILDRLADSFTANNTSTQFNRYSGPRIYNVDVNGDDLEDVLFGFSGSYTGDTYLRLALRQSDGSLVDVTLASGLPMEGAGLISYTDVNGDGLIDLLLHPTTAGAGLWIQAVDGTFSRNLNTDITNYLKNSAPYTPHVWWEDFDQDGDKDLAISLMRLGKGRVWENIGGGEFSAVINVTHWDADAMQVRSRAGYACDFNADGKVDVLSVGTASHGSTSPVVCWLNTSDVVEPPPPPPPPDPPGVILVLIDGIPTPVGTTVKIDGVLVPPPTGPNDKLIEVDTPQPEPPPEPMGFNIPLPDHDPTSNNFQRWLTGLNGSAWEHALAYRVTGLESHRELAISKAATIVTTDSVAGNQYLGSGSAYRDVFYTLDWCSPTQEQKSEWTAWGKRHLGATNGSIQESIWWTHRWSRDNPANNYYHSFILATSCYAMATNDEEWLNFLKNDRLPKMTAYYSTTIEGGSREGTGYGESHRSVFEIAKMWKDYDNTQILPQEFIDNSILYWVHATTPGHGWVALIGDHTRTHGTTDGYHRHIISSALALTNNQEIINIGHWQLSKLKPNTNRIFFPLELRDYPTDGNPPNSLEYHAVGAGHFFARTSWEDDATYLVCTAGKFDEAHQQEDQGAFAIFANGRWQTCSDSPWTHDGIAQTTDYQNVVKFDVPQKRGTSGILNWEKDDYKLIVNMDLSEPAQRSWIRNIYWYGDNRLYIKDLCDSSISEFNFCKPSEDDTREPYISDAAATIGKLDGGFLSMVEW